MADIKLVSIQRLMLDENNPRFRRPMAQDEAIAEFARSPKTRKLAKHISQYGLNPFDPIAVMSIGGSNKYIVREGNRRTAALKLLNNPELASEKKDSKYYAGLAGVEAAITPRAAHVVVISDEREMRRWIRLKHVPDQSGAATLFWQPWEKANFDDGSGPAAKYKYARELVNAAIEHGWIDDSQHDRLKLSTLSRVLEDEEARGIIGFSVDSNGLHTRLERDAQEEVVKRLISDTGRGGRENSRTLQKTEDLTRYAKQLVDELKLHIQQNAPVTRVGSKPASVKERRRPPTRTKPLPNDLDRNHVVPRGFRIEVTEARAADILKEMRLIDVEQAPNAVAVLFRIFLEFSVLHYAADQNNKIKPMGPRDDLNTMIVRVRDDLLARTRIKKGELAVLNKSISTPNHFLSISQINQWVHNPLVHPVPREVNAAWNGASALFVALWADYKNKAA